MDTFLEKDISKQDNSLFLVQVLIFSMEHAHLDGIYVLGSKCVRIDHLFMLIFDQLKEADIESYWSET
jgi:hypothetical protein